MLPHLANEPKRGRKKKQTNSEKLDQCQLTQKWKFVFLLSSRGMYIFAHIFSVTPSEIVFSLSTSDHILKHTYLKTHPRPHISRHACATTHSRVNNVRNVVKFIDRRCSSKVVYNLFVLLQLAVFWTLCALFYRLIYWKIYLHWHISSGEFKSVRVYHSIQGNWRSWS